MFISLLIFPLISILHILIHALFKSLLFLLAGSLIHIQFNFQSLYKIKLNNYYIKILFIIGVILLIFSFSKEAIIHYSNSIYNSSFIYIVGFICGMLTIIYSFKIYIYSFYLCYYGILYSSFILPMLTITSILIDQCIDCCFSFYSLSLFFAVDFGSLFSFCSYDMILCASIINFLLSSILLIICFRPFQFVCLLLSNELCYCYFFPFVILIGIYSCFFFKGPMSSIELFTGYSSCYSLYHIHYLSSFQYIIFFISFLCMILLLCQD